MPTVLNCPQCAASVEFPDDRLSDSCAFCETPLVRDKEGTAPGESPDLVAPFDLDRKVAGGRLARHLQDQFWAPQAVRSSAHPDDLKAVLVPFFCYDATARSTYDARVGIYWYRTETYTVWVNGKPQIRTRQVRETEWFGVSGTHGATYKDHLVSGSRGLPEKESNDLEPFDVGRARPFQPALVAGLVAERPSVDRAQAHEVARQELASVENAAIRSFLPGDTVADVRNSTAVDVGQVRTVMLPVWIGTYRHGGKVFRLLVNGQTGEIVGAVPKSWAKIGCAIALVLGVILGIAGCILGGAGISEALVPPPGSSSGRKRRSH